MNKNEITAVFAGGMAFRSQINGHTVLTDTGIDGGGNNEGPGPKQLMLSSLAGCTGIDVVSILNKMHVEFTDFSIKISARLTEDHPKIYDQVTIHYSIRLAEEHQVKMEKAIHLSMEKYCGVSAMFSKFAELNHAVTYL